LTSSTISPGWKGWDEYAAFYDWENARTLGRRDVAFWRALALRVAAPVLELGCGTGRVTLPLARAGVRMIGIDRSLAMLARARQRLRRGGTSVARTRLVRGDIRALPFAARPGRAVFPLVIAPYGILQSLVTDSDMRATLEAVAGVLAPGGTFAMDLVPDLASWQEYRRRVRLRGRRGASHVTLVESVRQDRPRALTIFDQIFIERRGARRSRREFTLTFRTLTVPQMRRRLERAGFTVTAVLGDYDGGPWDPRADVWIVVARKKGSGPVRVPDGSRELER
jgi:SAM-dependent methyltransferase